MGPYLIFFIHKTLHNTNKSQNISLTVLPNPFRCVMFHMTAFHLLPAKTLKTTG